MRAVRRREHVAVLHRGADADGGRLLADRDVEEAGQLSGAEGLLDLLLEAPDQQHLAQEAAKPVLRERRAPLLDFRHGGQFMLSRVALADRWDEIESELADDWLDARLLLPRPGERRGR